MEKVRFAVVGLHGIAARHMEGILQNPNAELSAICDIREEYLRPAAEKYEISNAYTDYDAMLEAGGFDCVTICTPDQVHKEQAVKALKAGYHVLCEKPLAMTLEDCRDIVTAAKASDKKFMVGQVCRKAPAFVLAKNLVEQGEIGDLYYIESEYAHDYSLVTDIGGWRHDPVNLRYPVVGGGCHAMDLLRWIAGDPTEVFAYANHKVLTDWPVDDCTVSLLKYPNNVIGKVTVAIGCKRPYTMRTQLWGTKGNIVCDNTSDHLTIYRGMNVPSVVSHHSIKYLPTEIPVKINNHNITAEVQDMCDCILKNLPVECDAVMGANTVAVCQAAVKSAAEGRPVAPEYFRQ